MSLILIYVVVFGALMMFMTTRGRRKQASQAQMMQSALMVGAEVRTIGGLVGTVVDLTDEYIVVETTPGVKLKFTKQAIAGVIPPETTEVDGYGTDPELEAQSADSDEVDESADPVEAAAREVEAESKAGAEEPEDAKDEQKVG